MKIGEANQGKEIIDYPMIKISTSASMIMDTTWSLMIQNSTSQACQDYVLISTRGTFEAQGPSFGFIDMIAWTLGNITGGIERDTVMWGGGGRGSSRARDHCRVAAS